MNRLLKVYLLNIFKQKGYYICLVLQFLFTVVISMLLSNIVNPTVIPVADRIQSVLEVGIVPIIFITLFVCSDFTDGATKNFISRGYTRRQILFTKYIAALIGVYSFFILNVIAVFILFAKDGIGFNSANIICIVGTLIANLAVIGFYVVVSNTLEKISASLTVNILINILLPTAGLAISGIFKIDFNVINYFVIYLPSLLPGKSATIKDLLLVSGLSIGYLLLLFEVSNFIIKRKEVK